MKIVIQNEVHYSGETQNCFFCRTNFIVREPEVIHFLNEGHSEHVCPDCFTVIAEQSVHHGSDISDRILMMAEQMDSDHQAKMRLMRDMAASLETEQVEICTADTIMSKGN